MTIFSELGKLKHLTPNADEVQNGIAAIQKFITDNYYECTNKVLSGLGEMYVGDERFRPLSMISCAKWQNFDSMQHFRQYVALNGYPDAGGWGDGQAPAPVPEC